MHTPYHYGFTARSIHSSHSHQGAGKQAAGPLCRSPTLVRRPTPGSTSQTKSPSVREAQSTGTTKKRNSTVLHARRVQDGHTQDGMLIDCDSADSAVALSWQLKAAEGTRFRSLQRTIIYG